MEMGSITPYGAQIPADRPSASSEWHEINSVIGAVVRRWKLFAATVVAFVAAVAIATLLTPKTYTTTVRMMAGSPAEQPSASNTTSLPILNALVLQSGAQSAETFATLAQQEGVAAQAASELHLDISPQGLLGHISVTPTTNTAILNLSATWRDPKTSAKIANAFADAFMHKERDFVRSQAVAAIGFLSGELPRAQAEMQRTGSNLAQFQADNGFVDANSHTQDVVAKVTTLDTKIETATLDRREAQALLDNASAQLATLPVTINNSQQISINPVLTDLQTRLEQVNIQLSQAMQQYTDQHPAVISLKKQRSDLMAAIARQPAQIESQNTLTPNPVYQSLQQQIVQYRQRIDGDAAQLSLLQRERTHMSPMLRELPTQSMQLATLQQKAKLASDVYNALEQKYNDAVVAETTAISDVTVIQPATADSAVVRPQLRLNVLAALVLGIIVGLVMVYVVEGRRRPVSGGNTDAVVFGLPVLARIPSLTTGNKRMLPWLQSMTVEAFLQLCVSLKLKNKRSLRTLAVTSPSRNDGKSTVAFNLAKAMANLDPRILLIDADLRRPSLHDMAQCNNKYGLSDVLQGTRGLNDSVQPLSHNVDLLAAGHCVDNPVGLIQSGAFDEVLREANTKYAMVIVDTPALTCVSDGYLITVKTDAAVLVISAHETAERETHDVVSRFSALGIDNLVGVVVNRDHQRVSDYSDYFARRMNGALPGSSL